MARKVEKRGRYDWYEWKVFLETDDATLASIKEVEYLLHSTFPDRRRIMKNRDENFILESAGWGSFNILVIIRFNDGSTEKTTHFLDLQKLWKDD
jgi:transcription initiation factor IIF auxiliary subunit